MPRDVRFVRNPNFKAELQAEPQFVAGMVAETVRTAEQIKLAAEPFRHTGNYIRNVKVRRTRIYVEPHFWHIIEFGSVNNAPQANVRRGVIAAGLRFEDSLAVLA